MRAVTYASLLPGEVRDVVYAGAAVHPKTVRACHHLLNAPVLWCLLHEACAHTVQHI